MSRFPTTSVALLVGSVLVLVAPSVAADNGSFAFASPVADIVIDGDLSDWPAGVVRQSNFSVQHFDYPTGPDDATVSFQVAYDKGMSALLVGFTVQDNSWAPLVDVSPEYQDRFGLFLDLSKLIPRPSSEESLNYYFHLRQDFKGWMSRTLSSWSSVDGIAQHAQILDGRNWTLELKIDLRALTTKKVELASGAELGLDVAYFDVDRDGTTSEYHWGRGIGKYEERNYGDLLLVDEAEELLVFSGRFHCPVSANALYRNFVHLRSRKHPNWPLLLIVGDEADEFRVTLPAGEYEVRSVDSQLIDLRPAQGAQMEPVTIETCGALESNVPMELDPPITVGAPEWGGEGQWFVGNPRELFSGIVVNEIAVGLDGTLWIGSNLGLLRYDGLDYTLYQPRAAGTVFSVDELAMDGTGRLWLASDQQGLMSFREGQFTRYESEKGVLGWVDEIFTDDSADVWFGGRTGLFRCVEGHFQLAESIQDYRFAACKSLGLSSQGSLWVAGPSNRLHRYFNGVLEEVPGWEQDRDVLRSSYGSLIVDASNHVYINSLQGRVHRIHDALSLSEIVWEEIGRVGKSVYDLSIDRGGNIWGVSGLVYELTVGDARRAGAEEGMFWSRGHSVVCDHNGVIWTSSPYDGIGRFRASSRERLLLPDNLGRITCSAALRDDWFIFGTEALGLVVYKGGKVEQISQEHQPPRPNLNRVTCLMNDGKGGVWVGTAGGVIHAELREGRLVWSDLPSGPETRVSDLAIHRGGHLLVATRDGLFVWNGREWSSVVLKSEDGEIASQNMRTITVDEEDRLWVSGDLGLSVWSAEWAELALVKQEEFGDSVNRVLFPRDGKHGWVGSRASGLFMLRGDLAAGRVEGMERFSVEHGLADLGVSHLLLDSMERLWVGTRNGLSVMRDGIVLSLGLRDGLPGSHVTGLSELEDGRLLVTTQRGAVLYSTQATVPKIAARLLGGSAGSSKGGEPTVLKSDAPVTIALDSYSPTTSRQQMAYQYRLRRNDKPSVWRRSRSSRITLDSLRAGSYRFEARAFDRDLNVSAEPAVLMFSVSYPYQVWLQRAIMVGLGLVASLTTAFAWLRNRQRQQSRRELVRQTLEHNEALIRANREAESAKEHAEKANEAKSVFLANISHEIRTPMNAIVGFSRFFSDPDLKSARRLRLASSIERSSKHLLGLVNDVLDFSKIEAGKVELEYEGFYLQELVDYLSEIFAARCEQNGLKWQVSTEIEPQETVRGDMGRMRQVLLNLLGNAVKFTDSGYVSLHVESRALGPMGRKSGDDGVVRREVSFVVKDSGRGIAPEDQSALFGLFEQGGMGREKGGTGLGLVIANRLAGLMGGRIEVASEAGVGATFTFAIPLELGKRRFVETERTTSGESAVSVPRGEDRCQSHILIVDDNADNRLLLGLLMERFDIGVEEASSGEAALKSLRRKAAALVLLDLRMPGQNGYQVLATLQEDPTLREIPVVAVTAAAFQHEKEACLAKGFHGFLSKPVDAEELKAVVSRFLGVHDRDSSDSDELVVEDSLVTLDSEVLDRLHLLVKQYRRTELKEELKRLCEEEHQAGGFAERALDRVMEGDWEGLDAVLARCRPE